MQNDLILGSAIKSVDWYSEEFIYNTVVNFLKENGYKIHKDNQKETERPGRIITASKFFKKEVIEVKGFPYYYRSVIREAIPVKSTHVKSWFTEALFNSFVNFSLSDNAEVAMALPNVGRYQAIIKKLNDYFSINDLYFRIYLVNEDGSVEVSNLNCKYATPTPSGA
ncbi:MAG: hypothetical protein WKG06_19230 [Segetibacter sp.]